MFKTDAQPSSLRLFVVQFLLLSLLGQPTLPLTHPAAEGRRDGPSQSGRLLRSDMRSSGAPFKTDGASPAGPKSEGDAGEASQGTSCPAATSGPAAARLIYTGQVDVHCGAPLPVSAQLTDECGNALVGRRVNFTVGALTATTTTDDHGVARTSLVPPPASAPLSLKVTFAGDDDYSAAHDSASVRVARVNTSVRYVGTTALAVGVSERVSAVLTDATDGRPVPHAVLNFEVGSVKVSATTGVAGAATTDLTLPLGNTFERAPLKITFAGDDCHNPASAAAEVTAYLRTAFVVWGGNDERLRLGQRVNFWGHSWAKQVAQGDYKAHNDFKGYADTVKQSGLCQVNVRTTGRPPLDDSCWSTKPGQSFPPETIPEHIGVIVTTSMDKSGAPDFGNIAALVVVKVDPEPRYGAVPGKPGFGTIVAVIADGEGIFGGSPSLAASQTQPAAVLPAQSFGIDFTVTNNSATAATNVLVNESFTNLTPPNASDAVGTLPPSSSQARRFGATVPALQARREGESSQDYQKRLGAADGTVYSSLGLVSFQDATRRAFPPAVASSSSTLQLPRLSVGISAASCVSPGATIPYVIRLTNVGSATAASAAAVVTFPDGTSANVETTNLGPGQVFSSTVNWKVPALDAKGATETDADYIKRLTRSDGKVLKTSAKVTWTDAAGNAYGAVEQECSSVLRVPILSHTSQSPAPMLPGQQAALPVVVQNSGSGNALEARMRVMNPDASVFDAAPFSLAAGGSSNVQAALTAPPVAPKAPGEMDSDYHARLRAADDRPIDFVLTLEWSDAAGNVYGPVVGTMRTTEVLPIVLLSLSAPETVEAGDTITYQAALHNVGHAEAASINLAVTLPDGRVVPVEIQGVTLPPDGRQSAVVDFNVPATQAEGQLQAEAVVSWRDAIAGGYGPVSANVATNVLNPNLPPAVNAGADQTVVLPAPVSLNGTASDDGKPAGSTLTVLWTKVSGPGAVAFGNPNQAVTTATFGAEGTYVLRLSASDSVLSASDEMTVNVMPAPTGPSFTGKADFTQGQAVNLARDEFNHLHLNNQVVPFNFIWVAVSSKGTVVKIDTDTGQVIGEYFSSPSGQPKDPSRTTVDFNGNVWASNRAGNSVVRIGLVENGQCVDRNANGVIDTSRAQGDIRPWRNTGGVDTDGGVETAEDECAINYTRVTARGTRHVSVNAANDVWVSGTSGRQFDLLDGQTGQIKRQESSVGYGGYGGLIDRQGVIWSARSLLRWDTALPLKGANGGNWKGYGHDSYGLCIDSQGNVWNTSFGGNAIRKFAPDGTLIGTFQHGNSAAQGCVVDRNDDVWVAHSLNGQTVGHLKNDGTWVGNVRVGSGPTGVAVDARGRVWATNHNSRTVSRIDPDAGPIGADGLTRVGQVDFTTVNLGGTLYNYSDMTGSTLSGAPAGGTLTHVFDSGIDGAEWGVIGWSGQVCGDGALIVTASSSNDGRQFSAPVTATNGTAFTLPPGRHLKVVVTFKRASSGESPFLFDLTVGTRGFTLPVADNPPPVVDAGPDQTTTMPNAANLLGSVCDSGQVLGSPAINWEKIDGPGTVSFGNANLPRTSATFSEAGEYVLRLTASDSNLSASDEVTVLVLPFNDPPTVSAGADQSLILPAALNLTGTVNDDRLPAGSSVAVSWTKLSGPGEVNFTDPTAATAAASFSQPGEYVLRLTGDDSQFAIVDDIAVKVFPPNTAPAVNAGVDATIRLPEKATLDATATDDGLPLGKTLTFAWSKVSGPGTVSFAKATAADTTATFGQPGTYVLRLSASDSQLSASDELTVFVNPANQPPAVNAGTDQTITLPDAASLNGTIADDDLPEGRIITSAWSKVSGPGVVIFGTPDRPATTASFSEAGTYVLRLTASDSALSRSDDVAIAVKPSLTNLPPTVNAGADQTITLPAKASLVGAVGDDRQPAGSALTSAWSKVSGPGNVTFGNVAAAATTATFSAPGQYVLRLTASDTVLTTADDLAVTVLPVNQPPTVNAGPDQVIPFPNAANLSGSATDDGQPPGRTLTLTWSKVSGPGTVSFADAGTAATTATFSTGGRYVLRLTASDSALSRTDDVAVSVNQGPTADAGADLSINLPNAANLQGKVTDDALPPGKTIVVAWSKVSGPGAVSFAKPHAASTAATFSEVGTYVLRLSADDTMSAASDEMTVTAKPPLPPPPSLAISGPTDGAEITSRVDFTGSISHGNWKLEYSLAPDVTSPHSSTWTTFASGNTPVTNGVLGTFDPTLLLNGTYGIRLTSTDESGRTTSVIRNAVVNGQQKVGNFTVSFDDLNVPVAGLPIQLIRTYDSRNKGAGDFGVGWTLGIRNVRLEKSVELGRHWRGTVASGTLPQYCLQPTRPNIVTITFPDDRVYKFQATTVKQCQLIAPIQFATFGFTPMPGTRGTLVPEASLDIMVLGGYPGPVELLDSADPQLRNYDPTVFRFTDENGTVFVIDQKLGVRSITDPNGNRLTVNRDGLTHSSGKSVRFLRDPQGRITQIVDPQGNTMTYTYDAAGDLSVFRDRENNETRFTYNNLHGLLDITDSRGIQPVRNEYDEKGRLLSHTDAFGKKITYSHDLSARQELITDRLGNATLYSYDARGNVVRMTDANGGVTTYTYDSRDNKLSETDPLGKTTTFAYDANDNLVREVDPLGNVMRYTYNSRRQRLTTTDARGRTVTNTYDSKGNPTSTRDALGNLTTSTYIAGGRMISTTSPLGDITRFEYDGSGNRTKEVNALGHVVTATYDANGNRTSQTITRTTPSGTETLTTGFQHDKLDRLTKIVHPDGTTTQMAYNQIGKRSATIDQLQRETRYEYDPMGRLSRTTYPDGTTEGAAYDAEGRRLTDTDQAGRVTLLSYDGLGRLVGAKYADGSTRSATYDAAGRVVSETDERGNTTRFTYDAAGRRTHTTDALNNVTTFTYDADGNLTAVRDANGNVTTYEYDANDRRTRVVYADGTADVTGYDALGRTMFRTDQAGKTTRFEYDSLGRLLKVIDALGRAAVYAYDEAGNQVSHTDGNNHVTRYEYDRSSRRTKRVLPLGMSETYTYNAAGSLASKTDFRGKTTTYTYDAMNRLIGKTYDASLGEPQVRFTYTATGKRASMIDASGETTYRYDSRDRLTSKATSYGALSYTYDAASNLLSLTSSNANGASVTYSYDALNRLASVTDGRLANGTTAYTYDAVGNLAGYEYPNGVRSTYGFNALNRLASMTVGKASTLASYAYTLGAAGNRLSVAELDGRKVNYSYDDAYRLTGENISDSPVSSNNGAVGYTYDAVGNRLNRTSTVATVPSSAYAYDANNRLIGDSYDANGNTTASGDDSYGYDSENRLQRANNGEVINVYDGDGNRVATTVNGVTTRYLVDSANPTGHAQVIEEIVEGNVQRTYAYGHDLINQRRLVSGDWVTGFYGYDGHGNVRFLTDASGAITDTYTYDAFGILTHSTGTTPNDYLYAGERFDSNLGLYYLRARYMNPAVGRFWSMDDFAGNPYDPVSLHKYLYANADPVNNIDPTGRFTLMQKVAVISIVVSLGAFAGSAVLRYTGWNEAADRWEGFGRIAGGVAFIASAPTITAVNPALFYASIVAGLDEIYVGAMQMIYGGRPASPLERFLMSVGLSERVARGSLGLAKILLSIGPRSIGIARNIINWVRNARGRLSEAPRAILEAWRRERGQMMRPDKTFEKIEHLDPIGKYKYMIEHPNEKYFSLNSLFLGGRHFGTAPTGGGDAGIDIIRMLENLYVASLERD